MMYPSLYWTILALVIIGWAFGTGYGISKAHYESKLRNAHNYIQHVQSKRVKWNWPHAPKY